MKFLKKFTMFEKIDNSLSSEQIDLVELEHILIDFEQMGLDYDIKTGSSVVIDWNLVNDIQMGQNYKSVHSNDIDRYRKPKVTNNSLTIEFNINETHTFNVDDTKEAYEMLKDYLFENYNLIPNYIYVNFQWNYVYFEDFDNLQNSLQTGYQKVTNSVKNHFKAHKLLFGFYK